MFLLELFLNYWRWHYSRAILNILLIWRDFTWFLWNFFSVRQMLRTFFLPYKRLREEKPSLSEFFDYFSAVAITLIMRIVGMIVRSAVIFAGIFAILLLLVAGVLFLIVWLAMPLILMVTLIAGVQMIVIDLQKI